MTYLNSSTSWRDTPAIYSLILLNLVVYVTINYLLVIPGLSYSCYGGLSIRGVIVGGEFWRIISSMFVHYDFSHIAFNMLALLIFGSYAEKSFGSLKTFTIYLSCGLFANIVALSLAYMENDAVYCAIGASGAILGLAAATACLMWQLWRYNRNPTAYMFARQLAIIFVIQFVIDLFVPNVSMVHHLSGAVAGIIIVYLLSIFKFKNL